MRRLTDAHTIEEARGRIRELLDARGEWFFDERAPRPSSESPAKVSGALRRGEWELGVAHGALLLSLLTDAGPRVWRVAAWEFAGGRLTLEATRRAGGVRALLDFVPRASVAAARAELSVARRAACERLAALACARLPGARVESAALSRGSRRGEPGRYARVVLARGRERVAFTGPVAELTPQEADDFLAASLAWLARLEERARDSRPSRLRLAVPRALTTPTAERLALLRDELRRLVVLDEFDETRDALAPVALPELDALLDDATRLKRPVQAPPSRAAAEIAALAPDAVDIVRARHGETLRFRGLPFARVRRLTGRERVWFGVWNKATGRAAREEVSDGASRERFAKLIDELAEYRRAATPNPRHAFYRAAPEAWLESLLRRDITRLDPGLRLSPLHAQFRTSGAGRPVDLLALRRDGRLVVVELKTAEDAALPLQGADYWRRVEAQRLRGALTRARLFGDEPVADAPPLLYLVAPLLSFHRDFDRLARALTPRVETYRFDLNEDWRTGVRVARRARL